MRPCLKHRFSWDCTNTRMTTSAGRQLLCSMDVASFILALTSPLSLEYGAWCVVESLGVTSTNAGIVKFLRYSALVYLCQRFLHPVMRNNVNCGVPMRTKTVRTCSWKLENRPEACVSHNALVGEPAQDFSSRDLP